uniref:Uncharacterized protein n=1 Tax=Quercus lobata TaxID=97700 RepID=A0A7N2MPM0_QUELO
MGFSHIRKDVLIVLLFVTILFASSQVGAMRSLGGEQWLKKESLLLQSVQRGPVTPSGPQSMHLHPWSEQGHLPLASQCCHAHSNSVVGVAVAFYAIEVLDQD